MNKAVFLDRDGVINALILNPQTGEYESPLTENDLKIAPEVFSGLKKLQNAAFLLCIVSNQPNYAKGKASLEFLHRINQLFSKQMLEQGVILSDCYYCYHHPKGIIQDFSGECLCRKPKPYFLLEAQKKFGIDMKRSWMVGDQDSDIECGQRAGVRTILIDEIHSIKKRGTSTPDYQLINFSQAVEIILENG